MLSVIGQHGNLPIEQLKLSQDGNLLTTCSHDNVIKFWDVSKVYEQEPVTEKKCKKRKNVTNMSNAKAFFADL